jgi:hypothetical protein
MLKKVFPSVPDSTMLNRRRRIFVKLREETVVDQM